MILPLRMCACSDEIFDAFKTLAFDTDGEDKDAYMQPRICFAILSHSSVSEQLAHTHRRPSFCLASLDECLNRQRLHGDSLLVSTGELKIGDLTSAFRALVTETVDNANREL